MFSGHDDIVKRVNLSFNDIRHLNSFLWDMSSSIRLIRVYDQFFCKNPIFLPFLCSAYGIQMSQLAGSNNLHDYNLRFISPMDIEKRSDASNQTIQKHNCLWFFTMLNRQANSNMATNTTLMVKWCWHLRSCLASFVYCFQFFCEDGVILKACHVEQIDCTIVW